VNDHGRKIHMSGNEKFLTMDEALEGLEVLQAKGGMGGLVAAMEAAGEVVGRNKGTEWVAATSSASDHGRAR
jgi:hypothetical protein